MKNKTGRTWGSYKPRVLLLIYGSGLPDRRYFASYGMPLEIAYFSA